MDILRAVTRLPAAIVTLLAASSFAVAQTPAAECEALAGGLGPTPAAEALDQARTACAAAVREAPGAANLLHLYGRTLELSGDLAAAGRLYEWAAGDGYDPATQALARLSGGPTADTAPVEESADADPGPSTPGDVVSPDGEETELAQTARQLEQVAAMMEAARALLPRAAFDPSAVVAAVGTDPATLAGWVETHTALVPYRGRLRGPVGVLLDRYGNSLDRALLLAELLQTAGHRAELVRGTLPAEDAGGLIAARPDPPPLAREVIAREVLLAQLGIDPANDPLGIVAALEDGARQAAGIRDGLMAATRAQGDALLALISGLAAPVADRSSEIEALQDHWWVRVQTPTGWQDLDPSGASARATGPEAIPAESLPEDLSHRVTISVVAEFLDPDGRLRGETLLSHVLQPADLVGVSVLLWHEPITVPPPAGPLAEGDAGAMVRALIAERSWQPALLVGSEVFADRIATTDGTTLAGDPAGIDAARLPFQGMIGGFGGLLTDFDGTVQGQAATDASVLVAEWLVFEIAGPGKPAIEHRRAIFDLLDPTARANGGPVGVTLDEAALRTRAQALLERIDIGIWGATPSTPFVADALARELAPLFGRIAELLRRGSILVSDMPALGDLPRSQAVLHGFAAGRAGLTGTAPLILDHPNIVLLRHGQGLGSDGPTTGYTMIDVVENGVAQVAAPAAGAFAARLRQGVVDTVLESVLLGAPEPSHNTSVRFAADLAAGRSWVAVSRPQEVDRLGLPPDVAADVVRAVDDGYLAVVPPDGSGMVAWWRIDAATGTTLGIGPTGAGSEMVEYIMLVGKVVGFAGCLVGAYSAAASAESAGEAVATGVATAVCLLGTSLSILASSARMLFLTSPMTAAAAADVAAGWALADAIGGLAAVGGGTVLSILGL